MLLDFGGDRRSHTPTARSFISERYHESKIILIENLYIVIDSMTVRKSKHYLHFIYIFIMFYPQNIKENLQDLKYKCVTP